MVLGVCNEWVRFWTGTRKQKNPAVHYSFIFYFLVILAFFFLVPSFFISPFSFVQYIIGSVYVIFFTSFLFIPFSSLSLSLSLNIMDDIMCMLSFLSLALSFLYLSIIQHFHDLHYTTMGHTGTYYHWLVDYGWFA